ncbi:MAG: hypothetical protein V4454_19070 [Pseudomonadota bacterium]
MFSDHLQKPDRISGSKLLLMAGGLVIACQLVAMVMVAGEQVKKAEMRDSRQSLQRAAIAQCFEANTRAERQSCMLQVREGMPAGNQIAANAGSLDPVREAASYTDFNRGTASSGVRADVMAVTFATN